MAFENSWSTRAFGLVVLAGLLAGCTPGYMKASKLEDRGQGPEACANTCDELKMRMVALVLVGDEQPGCVCQVLQVQGAAPAAAIAPATPDAASPPPPAPTSEPPAGGLPPPDGARDGAAASTAGYVVIAAAAARQQQAQQQRKQQQAK